MKAYVVLKYPKLLYAKHTPNRKCLVKQKLNK